MNKAPPRAASQVPYAALAPPMSELHLGLPRGGQNSGNFISVNSWRAPIRRTLCVFMTRGNEENAFSFQSGPLHVNLGFTRSWFSDPERLHNLNTGVTDPVLGNPILQIKTFNIVPPSCPLDQCQYGVHLWWVRAPGSVQLLP